MSITPGPWEEDGSLITSETGFIFEAFMPYDELKAEATAEMAANIRLVTAAPDMLALIPELAAYVSNELIRLKDLGADFEKEREAARATLEKANAVLGRIKGEGEQR